MKATLIVIGLVLALGVSEIALRVLGLAPEVAYIEKWRMRIADNPKIGYEPIPNLDSSEKSVQYYGYRGASNALGFRDHDHPLTAPASVQRVIALGDSVTAGLWLAKDEDTYPAQLEKLLRAHGENIEVMNFGVLGYNTAQEVETLREKGLQFDPDLVILTYCLNDQEDDSGGIMGFLNSEAQNAQHLTPEMLHPSLKHSALYRFLKFRVVPTFSGPQKQHVKEIDIESIVNSSVESAFADLARISQDQGFPVVVVLFPDFTTIDTQKAPYPRSVEHAAIRELSETHGFGFVDLLEPMKHCKSKDPSKLLSFDRFHARPDGTRCAAQALVRPVLDTLSQARS